MLIPTRNIGGFAADVVRTCSADLPDRINRGAAFRNLYLTGDDSGNPATYPKVFDYIEDLSAYLYSPVELRWKISAYGSAGPTERAKDRAATSRLHQRTREANLDTMIGEAVTWSLVKGKTFIKNLWGSGGFDAYLVQPEFMGVERPDIPELDRQQAFFHCSYYTLKAFEALIAGRTDAKEIMRKVMRKAKPGKDANDPQQVNMLKQVMLGGLNPFQESGAAGSKNRGLVNWLDSPKPTFDADVLAKLIRLDEVYLWDHKEDDWVTIQVVDDVAVSSTDRLCNIFAENRGADPKLAKERGDLNPLRGHHPFVEFSPNRLDSYFWGRSELCNVALLQYALNQRVNGINKIMRLQEDPPRAFLGAQSVNQNAVAKLRKPGGYLVDSAPNAKIETLRPEMPTGIFESVQEILAWFNDMAGMAPVLEGRGEAGVRSQSHAETLVRTASPRFKKRAINAERDIERFGGLCLDMLKAHDPHKITAWVMPKEASIEASALPSNDLEEAPAPGMKPIEFSLYDLPSDAKVSVDAHSSSPAFSHETRELIFALAKLGAINAEQLIAHSHPPSEDELIDDAERKKIEQAAFLAAHPEVALKSIKGGKAK